MYALRHGNVWTLTVLDDRSRRRGAEASAVLRSPATRWAWSISDGATGNLNYLWRTGTVTAVSTVAAAEDRCASVAAPATAKAEGSGSRCRRAGTFAISVLERSDA